MSAFHPKALHVDAIVGGSIQREGNQLRIVLRLVQGPTDRQLWTDKFEGDVGDFFQLDAEIPESLSFRLENFIVKPLR